MSRAAESFDGYVATGTKLTLSQLVPPFAEFLIEADRAAEALERLDDMIAQVTQRRELAYGSELYRVRAKAKRQLGLGADADVDASAALSLALAPGAGALEVRAKETIASLQTAL